MVRRKREYKSMSGTPGLASGRKALIADHVQDQEDQHHRAGHGHDRLLPDDAAVELQQAFHAGCPRATEYIDGAEWRLQWRSSPISGVDAVTGMGGCVRVWLS